MSWETFNEEGFRTLHDVQSFRGVRNPARSQNARFSLAHRLAATFPGAGNASRKPETTVTEATTAGRGDNCGEVHNGRGRVGPRGLNRPPCSTKSSSAGCEWRIVVAVLISSRPVSALESSRGLRGLTTIDVRALRGSVLSRTPSSRRRGSKAARGRVAGVRLGSEC